MTQLKKLKIYLDTSVISHLDQNDLPDKMADTLKLWEDIKLGLYDVYISSVTLSEIHNCCEPKRTKLYEYLGTIDCIVIEIDSEINSVEQQFIDNNILTLKNFGDCQHIACTIVYECDCIISWNFKHIVNIKTQKGVKIISAIMGYDEVAIYTPTFLVEGE